MNIFLENVPYEYEHVLETATRFYLKKLVPANIRKELNITLEVRDDYPYAGMHVNEDMFDESGELEIIPDVSRNFAITLRNCDINDMIRTLAHELVHTKQHALGEMSYAITPRGTNATNSRRRKVPPIMVTWKGEPWFPKRGECEDYDSPWEREAYGMEVGLAHQFNRYWNRNYK